MRTIEVDRSEFQLEFAALTNELEKLGIDWWSSDRAVTSDTFSMRPYYWGLCTCGAGEDSEEHSDQCRIMLPNFQYKPTDYNLEWYKYPLRSAMANKSVSVSEFRSMIQDCILSLERGFTVGDN